MGQGDRLASGSHASAMFGGPVKYNLDNPLTNTAGAFPCACGKKSATATAFVDHIHGDCKLKDK